MEVLVLSFVIFGLDIDILYTDIIPLPQLQQLHCSNTGSNLVPTAVFNGVYVGLIMTKNFLSEK